MCGRAHYELKPRSPLWPGSHLRALEDFGIFLFSLVLSPYFKQSDTKLEEEEEKTQSIKF